MSSERRRTSGGALVVELIGTPGAGKTTVARGLVPRLRARGCEAASVIQAARPHAARTALGRAVDVLPDGIRRPLLWQLFNTLGALEGVVFAFEHRALARRLVRTQLARPTSAAMKRHTLYWFIQLAGRYRLLLATSNDGEAILFDDGFLHRAVAIHASHLEEVDPDEVAAYVDLLPRPDAVLHVTAPLEVCERRVRARGVWPHSRRLTEKQLSRYIANAERAVDAAVRRARELGWTVIEIENGEDAIDLAARRRARETGRATAATGWRAQARFR